MRNHRQTVLASSLICSLQASFVMQFRSTCLGDGTAWTGGLLLHQLIIKTIPHRHAIPTVKPYQDRGFYKQKQVLNRREELCELK